MAVLVTPKRAVKGVSPSVTMKRVTCSRLLNLRVVGMVLWLPEWKQAALREM
jgi:hypothetical protein